MCRMPQGDGRVNVWTRARALLGAATSALTIMTSPVEGRAESVSPPRPKDQPAAEWPGGISASHDVVVPVVLTIGADGRVVDVTVEASIGADFDEAAVAAARRWTFEPARREDLPVPAKIRAVVRFQGAPPNRPPGSGAPQAGPGAPPAQPIGVTPAPNPVSHPEAREAVPAPSVPARIAVRVTGARPPRSASEAVRSREVLQAAPHKTASDLLSVVPGVFVTQHSGQGKAHQIFLRGFDAVHGQDVEIWVAGAPVNEVSNVHGQGYADMHFIMPEVVEAIRATPGTYDPRQGDFAIAGTVRYDLGYPEPGVTAQGTLGSFGERRVVLAYRPANAPETTFAAFEAQSTDGFGPARAARRTSAVAQATYDFGGAATARVMASAYAGRFNSAGVLRLRDIEGGATDRFASYDPKQGGDSSRAQVVIAIESPDGEDEGSAFSVAPYFVARSLRLRSNFTGFLQDPIEGDSVQQTNDAITVGATGFYRKRLRLLSDHDAIEAGFSLRTDWIDQSQARLSSVNDRPLATEVDASVRAVDAAGYLDASLFISRRVALRGGLRVDGLSYAARDRTEGDTGAARSALGTHIGPRATIDVAALPGLHAIASFGQGFRSPQARSLGDGERTPFTRVLSLEAGARYREGDAIQSSLSAFHTRLTDDLVFDQATARNEPVPSTQRTGFALDLSLRPRSWIAAGASFTYARAAFTASDEVYHEGDLVPYVPQIVARSDIAFTPVIARLLARDLHLHVGAGLTLLVERPLPYGEVGHDVFLADASVGLRLRELQIRADLHNILGAPWFDGEFVYPSNFSRGASAELVPLRHVTAGAPRSVFVTASIFL